MLLVNRGWLKHEYWDIFDENVMLEHINISPYTTVLYVFGRNAKIIIVSLRK